MPAVTAAALVAGAAAAGGAWAAGTAIGVAFAVAFSTTLASGLLARALAEKPDLPDSSPLGAGLQVTGLSPAQPRRILYGRQRVGGQVVLRAATGRQNSLFHQIVVWAGHEVEAIETVYGDDAEMPGNHATLTANDIYFEDLGDEIKSTTTILDDTFTTSGMVIKVSGAPDDQEGRDLNGYYRIKDDPLREDTQHHELNVFRLDYGPISDTLPGPTITLTETYSRIRNHLGTAGQAADSVAVNEIPHWTSAHKLSGCAYTYATLFYSPWHFKSGLPNITAVIKGKKCYDPRKDSTNGGSGSHRTSNPNTWEYTRNSALICADWLTDTVYGLAVPWANLDLATLISAANVCDETVVTTSGTVSRYVTDAAINANEDRRAVLHKLAAAMAGYVVQTGAQWAFRAGAYETPTISLDESDLRGTVQITPKRSRQELFNSAKASFRDAALDWQPTTAEPVEDTGAIAQDNGEQLWNSLRYDYTTDREAVTRLMKIELLRNRQQATVNVRVGLSGLAITAGTTIKLSISRYGWVNKPFFVERWGLEQYADEKGAPAIGVGLTLRETDASVYTWGAGEASPTPSPESLPAPDWASMDAPTDLTLASGTSELLVASDGTIISRIKATWSIPDGAFSNRFELRYRRSADIPWAYLPADAPTAWIAPVNDLDLYDIGVRAFNALGVPSSWTSISDYQVIGKTEPPPDVDSFTVVRLADGTRRLTWLLNSVPDDVRVGGGYRVKYQSGSSITWSTAQALHDNLLVTSPHETNQLAAGTWTFGVVAVDSTGNESLNPLTLTVTLGDPRLRNVLVQRIEQDLEWPGTLSDGVISPDNVLREAGTWGELPDTWSALADTWGGLSGGGGIVYETEVIDVGSNATFTPLVTAVGQGVRTLEMRTGTEADGTVVGAYAPIAQVAGARYIQIRATVATPATLVTLVTLLDAETLIDEYEDIDTATASEAWFERVAAGHFRVAARKSLSGISFAEVSAIQNITGPHSWGLVSKSATVTGNPNPAAEFKLWNSSGTLVDALVDVTLKGPKSA